MGISTRRLHPADWELREQYEGLGAIRRLGLLEVPHCADAVLLAGDVFNMNEVGDRVMPHSLNTLAQTASCGWGVRRTFTWLSRARLVPSTKDA